MTRIGNLPDGRQGFTQILSMTIRLISRFAGQAMSSVFHSIKFKQHLIDNGNNFRFSVTR
jgi:hypothetical protein